MKRLVNKVIDLQVQESIHKVYDADGNDVTPKPLVSSVTQKPAVLSGLFSPCSTFAKSPSIPTSDRSGEPPPAFSDPGSARLEGFLKTPKISKSAPRLDSASSQPEHVSVKLTLKETNTMWLLELPSTALPEDDPQAEELKKEIERYDWLTNGKGKNRKLVDAETQTLNLQAKRKETMTTPIETKDVHTFVSAWDLYDTYEKSDSPKHTDDKGGKLFAEIKDDSFPIKDMDKFLQSALIMERLLASNNFRRQQAMFTGYPAVAESSEKPSRFQYEMCPLWIFQSAVTKGRAVMALTWNPSNKDILAVGYGQYLVTEVKKTGLVCCWSTKNPTQPERTFTLSEPVTSLGFSHTSSRILAVGQQDGTIVLLDVATRSSEPYITSSDSPREHMGPVWCLKWKTWGDSREVLLSTGQDGQICRWILSRNFYALDGMRLQAPLYMTCIDTLHSSNVCSEVPTQKFLSGLDLSLSTLENPPTLYVATKEGYLVEVELELQCRRIRKIHRGPVFSVQVSPFCHQVVLTAGANGNVCVWCKDNENPLLTLAVADSAVVGAAWSPSHSTILACINENKLSLWDITRKTHAPVSSVDVDVQLTSLSFCTAGRNILVGDKDGRVHVFSLQDMPYAPYMQVEAMSRAIPGLKHYLTAEHSSN